MVADRIFHATVHPALFERTVVFKSVSSTACNPPSRTMRSSNPYYCLLLLFVSTLAYSHAAVAPILKTRPPTIKLPEETVSQDIVHFSKNLYQELGTSTGNDTEAVIDKYRPQFAELDKSTEGILGQTLASLAEIRLLDLQASVRHARRLQAVFQEFTKNPAVAENI